VCGRYYIADDDPDEILAAYIAEAQGRADRAGLTLSASGEIRPTNIVPVIATSATRRAIGAYPMKWGFTHPTRGMMVINTRSETAAEKPLFCTSVEDRRCLIPASGYFEWKKEHDGKKTKYAFMSKQREPLYIAGLYLRSSQTPLPYFTILTRDATDDLKDIHGRMPVILPREKIEDWLSPDMSYNELIDNAFVDLSFKTA